MTTTTTTTDWDLDDLPLRTPCVGCGGTHGRVEEKAGQLVLRCHCGRGTGRCVPRERLGLERRSCRSRPEVSPSQRARIYSRDNYRCVCCGRGGDSVILHLGHIIPADSGREMGMTDAELWADLNLAVQCEECNLGLGRSPVSPAFQLRLFRLWSTPKPINTNNPSNPTGETTP